MGKRPERGRSLSQTRVVLGRMEGALGVIVAGGWALSLLGGLPVLVAVGAWVLAWPGGIPAPAGGVLGAGAGLAWRAWVCRRSIA